MKTLARIACISLILPFISVPYSFAEDAAEDTPALSAQGAKDLIASMPGAKDATKGYVEEDVPQDFYDIYGRQLQYRENAKEFRSMLEGRRLSFTTPHVTARTLYRDNLAEVYKAESASYQEDIAGEDNDGPMSTQDMMGDKSLDVDDTGLVDVVDDIMDESDDVDGLKEEVVSSDDDVMDGETMKKVITSDDAPEFDPTDLEVEFGEDADLDDPIMDVDVLDSDISLEDAMGKPMADDAPLSLDDDLLLEDAVVAPDDEAVDAEPTESDSVDVDSGVELDVQVPSPSEGDLEDVLSEKLQLEAVTGAQ